MMMMMMMIVIGRAVQVAYTASPKSPLVHLLDIEQYVTERMSSDL